MACPSAQPHEKHCDACSSQLRLGLFCSACSRVQALGKDENYFSIFGQTPCFDINPVAIQTAFDELILDLHPDFHTQGDARDQALSLQHTALLHEAKDTLFDPFERGKYLLRLWQPNTGNLTVQPPPAFLMEMFELQEALDDLETKGGSASTLERHIQASTQATLDTLTENFQVLQKDPQNPASTQAIKEALAQLKFLLNLGNRLHQIKKNHG